MKLALVTRYYPPLIGGAEKVLSYLAASLAAAGAEVSVVTSRPVQLELPAREEVSLRGAGKAGCTVDAAPGRLTVVRLTTSRLRFWGTWRYMENLKRWFDHNPIDLAYVSMLKHDAYVAVGAGERLGFPVVLRPEGAGATGDVAWQSWGNFGRVIGLRCRRAAAFVAISESIEQELRDALSSGTMRESMLSRLTQPSRLPDVVAIPNGVPVPQVAWEPRSGWDVAPHAVFVGRLAAEKGLDVLIDAWPLVCASYPDARVTLVGEGPERFHLEARALRLGLTVGPGQTVDLPGAVGDVTTALRNADLFVLPSREEGMSMALLEAMALGIPLVASSIPGNRRLVCDFEHGRLAPADDPVALARAIVTQWEHFDCAVGMARAGRSRVEEHFAIQRVARRHMALFDDILRGRRRSSVRH